MMSALIDERALAGDGPQHNNKGLALLLHACSTKVVTVTNRPLAPSGLQVSTTLFVCVSVLHLALEFAECI